MCGELPQHLIRHNTIEKNSISRKNFFERFSNKNNLKNNILIVDSYFSENEENDFNDNSSISPSGTFSLLSKKNSSCIYMDKILFNRKKNSNTHLRKNSFLLRKWDAKPIKCL